MDIQPQTTQPISDDQELAKVLAGVSADVGASDSDTPAMSDVTPPTAPSTPPATDDSAATPPADEPVVEPAIPPMPEPTLPTPAAPVVSGSGDLDSVKQEAINELRPLVDKLNIAPDEKFDTYLLLIRSTDDRSLVAPAHEAARAIPDETRRAQALLDIIKEIDFLNNPQGQQE